MHALRLGFWLFCGVVITTGVGPMCGDDSSDGREAEFRNFVKRVEAADEEGWTPYWLGRSFEAGGLTFYGPGVADFGAEVEGGGVDYSYDAFEQEPFAGLDVVLYSQSAWALVELDQGFSGGKTTDVLGVRARYKSISTTPRPVDQVRLIAEVGDTVIMVIAYSLSSEGPGGPNENPLIDEDVFLSVVKQLRPYPE